MTPDVGEVIDGLDVVDLVKFLGVLGLLLFLQIFTGEPNFPGVEEFRHSLN